MPKGVGYGPNYKGKIHGGAGPKSTSDGKDLSKNAKNVISGTKVSMKPVSPSANAASRDK
jgi:hypothetical protein